MKMRHLIAVVPAALLVLTGCSSTDGAATSTTFGTPAGGDAATAALLDDAVAEMCAQVVTYIDLSQQQAAATGEDFDRAAKGEEFLGLLKTNATVWVAAYNEQAEATGAPTLDPATATWEDMPSDSRELIERAVAAGISGTC